jgi:membrane protein required for colicin V production
MCKLDLFLLIPICLGFIFGIFKGLIKELSALAALLVVIFGAKFFTPILAKLITQFVNVSSVVASTLAYIVLFIAILIAMRFLASVLQKIFEKLALGGLNKLLGGVFGALKLALLLSVFLNIAVILNQHFPLLKKELTSQSIFYKPVLQIAPELWHESKKLEHEK